MESLSRCKTSLVDLIRVFIIDDHPLVISGIKNMFRRDRDHITVTGSAPDVPVAIREAKANSFDFILLDLWIRNTDPLENLKLLRRKFPFKPVVILTYEDSALWQRKIYDAGASGYLLKTSKKPELREAFEKIVNERLVFPHLFEVAGQDRDLPLAGKNQVKEKLTPHQYDIVSLLSEGNSRMQIGKRLNISVSTIEKILTSIRKKFQASSNIHLIWMLTRKKIL